MSYNVLIVDDSAITRTIVKKSLKMCGLDLGQIHEAANGREALEKLATEWVDVVFADINMPEMNGIELVERMARDNLLVTIPVVIVSTERSETQMDALLKYGVRGYIKKPSRPEDFRSVLDGILGATGGSHAA
jgi:two-component system, chemotaxis family, chemotaxis protein CheY